MEPEGQLDESAILEEKAERQEVIPFQDDELAAAMTPSGDIYVTLNGVCNAIGLSPRPQLRRILNSPPLAKGLRLIQIKTAGGTQRVNCMRVDKVALWLAGVETSKVKEQFRPKIEAYQDELAPVATRIFMQVLGIPTAPSPADPRLAALAEQYDVLMAAAAFIVEHMGDLARLPGQVQGVAGQLDQAVQLLESLASDVQQLKREQSISPAQKQKISEAVEHIVKDSAGKPGEMKQGQVYVAMYRRFHVSSYGEIPAAQYEEVIKGLRDLWRRATQGTTPEQDNLF
jgi:hypothetical protein